MTIVRSSEKMAPYDWKTATPTEANLDETLLNQIAEDWRSHSSAHSLLISKGDTFYLERYFNGWGPNHAHPLKSVCKTWIATLLGIAIEKEFFIQVVDTKASDPIPEAYSDIHAEDDRRTATLEDLVKMRSGYQYSGKKIGRVFTSDNWIQDVIHGQQRGKRADRSSTSPHRPTSFREP